MANSSFIFFLLFGCLSIQLRMSSALLKEQSEGEVSNLGGMQSEELSSLIGKNAHQDETISVLKSQLKNHEDRIQHLEKKMIDSQQTNSMKNAINNQPKSNDDSEFNTNKRRVKRPFRLISSSAGPLQSKQRKDAEYGPSSCADLNSMGHTLNAFYMVKEKLVNSTKLQTIYCDFQNSASSDEILEKRLGFIDIKSSARRVYFYVQRNSSKATRGPSILRYTIQLLNVGGGMNQSTGIFTAPKPGVYHFDFTGVKVGEMDPLAIHLRVNGVRIGGSFSGFGIAFVPVSIHSTLKLKRGDRVDIFIEKGGLAHCGDKCIHFTGWLLEED